MRFLHSVLLLIAAISILSLSSQTADAISSREEAQDPVYTIEKCNVGVLLATNRCSTQCEASSLCDGLERPSPTTLLPNPQGGGYCNEYCEYKTIVCPIGDDALCDYVNCQLVSQECDDVSEDSCTSLGYCDNQCRHDPDPDCCQSHCVGSNDWFVGGLRCEQSNCCGDDSGEFTSQRDTACNGVCASSNDWPEFLPNVNDKACCDAASSAVFDGTCYQEGFWPYQYTPGSSGSIWGGSVSRSNLQPNLLVVNGKWSDCDAQQSYCEGARFRGFCGLNWIAMGRGLALPFGEYDSITATECCGDDAGEQYMNTSQDGTFYSACCGSETDCVDTDGTCVPQNTLSLNLNHKCTSGRWGPIPTIECAAFPGRHSTIIETLTCLQRPLPIVICPAGSPPLSLSVCDRTPSIQSVLLINSGHSPDFLNYPSGDPLSRSGACATMTPSLLSSISYLDLRPSNVYVGSSLSHDGLKAGDLQGLTNLQTIDLTDADLTSLPSGVFNGLTNLKELSIDGDNSLNCFPTGIFDDLTDLRKLRFAVQGSPLSPGVFNRLSSLQDLSITTNHRFGAPFVSPLTLPPGVLDGLTNLRTLSLDGNAMTSLHPDVFDGLTNLENLHLADNDLSSLRPGIFDGLTNLRSVTMDGNPIVCIPPSAFDSGTDVSRISSSPSICSP